MNKRSAFSRRALLRGAAAATITAPYFVRNLISAPPSGRLRHASFGAGGMAFADLTNLIPHPQLDLICVADVDLRAVSSLQQKYPDAQITGYQDWRELLDKEGGNLDSANIGTPDHMHGPIALAAMQLGIHLYIQKPLAHNLLEVRKMTEVAHEKKLVTQMGIQIHSSPYYRMAVELAQGGAIGKIKEVHLWSDRKWGDPEPIPDRSDPIPEGFNWDLWLGVAAERPYLEGYYHPGNWRKRVDFGTGSLGDMGCHIFDPVYEGLGLGSPLSVRSDGPPAQYGNWPLNEIIRYEFPGTQYTAGDTVSFTWYDGDARPPQEALALLGTQDFPGNGSLWLGTEGTMLLPHVGAPILLPQEKFQGYEYPKPKVNDHWRQFVDAILGTGTATASLDYSGPLTETVLLGALATHFPNETLEWDSAAMRIKNQPAANPYTRREYREGWEVPGLS